MTYASHRHRRCTCKTGILCAFSARFVCVHAWPVASVYHHPSQHCFTQQSHPRQHILLQQPGVLGMPVCKTRTTPVYWLRDRWGRGAHAVMHTRGVANAPHNCPQRARPPDLQAVCAGSTSAVDGRASRRRHPTCTHTRPSHAAQRHLRARSLPPPPPAPFFSAFFSAARASMSACSCSSWLRRASAGSSSA
jgi:hypothetical protein